MDQLVWDLQDVSAWLEPYRHAWYALPVVMLVFIATLVIGYVYAWKKGVFKWR